MDKKYLFPAALSLLLVGVLGRVLPHAPNATPIVALAFTSSLYLGSRYWALVLPLGAMIASDILIGFYDWHIMLSVYVSFAIVGILSWLVQKHRNFLGVSLTLLTSSILFFLITNGAVWFFSPWYEKSITGLLYAYELGIPFFRNMFVGDLIYTSILIGVFESAFVLGALFKKHAHRAHKPLSSV